MMRRGGCPICGRPALADFIPFCSKRCADVDLHRWLTGAYVLPAGEGDDAADAGPERRSGEPDAGD
jgi:hypothetical protein